MKSEKVFILKNEFGDNKIDSLLFQQAIGVANAVPDDATPKKDATPSYQVTGTFGSDTTFIISIRDAEWVSVLRLGGSNEECALGNEAEWKS